MVRFSEYTNHHLIKLVIKSQQKHDCIHTCVEPVMVGCYKGTSRIISEFITHEQPFTIKKDVAKQSKKRRRENI